MWTGLEALSTIDQSLHDLRRQMQQADAELQSTSRQLVEVRQRQTRRYAELAQVRLDRLVRDELAASLDDTDRDVQTMLDAREEELKALERALSDNQQAEQRLEAEREAQRRKANEIVQSLDAAEAAAQEKLQADAQYLQWLDAARQADAIAREAESKTAQAASDRQAKGQPYESDPLFMYLWRRRYGTADYQASAPIRFLDGWVARLCRFHEARPNYWMLLEIPLRLQEHAARLRSQADERLAPVKQRESEAAAAEGVPAIAANVQAAHESLAELDRQIADLERNYEQLLAQRKSYAAGQDETLKRCLESLARQLEHEPLSDLRQHARATPSPGDDAIVHDLVQLDAAEEELDEALQRHQQVYDRHLARVKELEDVRRKFKSQDFDGFGSIFANEALIKAMLTEFLRGMASGGDFWGTIRGNHRRSQQRSRPTFGSGGFPFPSAGGSWQMPRFPSGGGGRRSGGGSSGGMGGGGFRTTGGF
jgi:hypothetical protein